MSRNGVPFDFVHKFLKCGHSDECNRMIEIFFAVLLFIILYNLVPTFEPVSEIIQIKAGYILRGTFRVLLFILRGSSNF